MKRNPLIRFIPARLALLVAPLIAAWPQFVRAADQQFTGGTGANWHVLTNWTGGAGFPGVGLNSLAGEGAAGDIATAAAANAATNLGINMGTLGGQLSLGAIHLNKTNTATLTVGNISTTVSGILLLNGATVNAVPNTILRNAGSGSLTISDRNTGSAAVTMGVQLGITNGIMDVATGRTLTINSSISELNPASGFDKTGVGTLILTAANQHTGTTRVSDGVLQLRNDAAAGTGPILVTNSDGAAVNDNSVLISGGRTISNPITLENTGNQNARTRIQSSNTVSGSVNTWAGDITFKGPSSNQTIIADNAPLIINGNFLQHPDSASSSIFIRGGNTGTMNGNISLGSGSLVKTDAGTWTINSTGNFMGPVVCADGLLILNNNDALEPDSIITMGQGSATTGRFQINAGFSQKITGIATPSNIIPSVPSTSPTGHPMNGPGTLDTGVVMRPFNIYDNVVAQNDVTMNLQVTGTGGFEKLQDGTLAFNNTADGPVRVSAGRLQGTGTYSGGITVGPTGILGAGGEADAGTVTVTDLTLEQDGVLQLNVGSASDLVSVSGAITVPGTATIRPISSGPLAPGTYNLIDYGTNVPALSSLTLGTIPSRGTGSLIDTGTHIALRVTAVDKVVWTGASGTAWDDFSTSWKLQSAAGAIPFQNTDHVIFDDTGTNTDVTVDTLAVSPSQIDFTNTAAVSYSVNGTKPITGPAGISKTGNGRATLLNTNNYTGATSITDGTLVANFNSTEARTPIGVGSAVSVVSPGTLQLVANSAGFAFLNQVSGNGTVEMNPRIVSGATTALACTFTGTSPGFDGRLRLLSPAGGTWRLTSVPAAALGTSKIEVQNAAQLYTANGQTYSNEITLTGTGYAETGTSGNLGALRLEANSVWAGNVIISGSARINSNNTGVANGGTVSGNISGGDLEVNASNFNNGSVVHLTGTNNLG